MINFRETRLPILIGLVFIIFNLLMAGLLYQLSPWHGVKGWPYPYALFNWDGGNYLSIVEYGYIDLYLYAFFPLYPLLIKLLTVLVGNFYWSALFVSWSAFLAGLTYLYKLLRLDYSQKITLKIIFLMLIFPTSFFLVVSYSESLFLFLSVSCFYYLRKNKLLFSTILAMLASVTRPVGIVMVLIVLGYLMQSTKRQKLLLIPLLFSGFCCYLFFLNMISGDPFIFIKAQGLWHRNLGAEGLNIFYYWQKY